MPNPAWVGRLISVIRRWAPRFVRVLPATPTSEGTGPLEKSAALYQKDPGTTRIAIYYRNTRPWPTAPGTRPAGRTASRPLVARRGLSWPTPWSRVGPTARTRAGIAISHQESAMRFAALPLLFAPLLAQAATLSVCTEPSPEGFDVVQYNEAF